MNIPSPEYTNTVKHTVSTGGGGGGNDTTRPEIIYCVRGEKLQPLPLLLASFTSGSDFYSRSHLVNTKPRTSDLLVPGGEGGGEGGVMHGEASGRENTDGYHRGRQPEARSAPGEAEVVISCLPPAAIGCHFQKAAAEHRSWNMSSPQPPAPPHRRPAPPHPPPQPTSARPRLLPAPPPPRRSPAGRRGGMELP